jgi:glucose dehydrogenase
VDGGIFARRPESGEAVWFYQWSPHDLHDYDGVNENVLVDLDLGGTSRKVLLHPDRNGYLYVVDRRTGEVISADPFVHVTSSLGVTSQPAPLRYNPAKIPEVGKVTRDICPGSPGAKDWQPSAWSPRTRLLYVPHQKPLPGRGGDGDELHRRNALRRRGPEDEARSRSPPRPIHRVDPVARKKAWTIDEDFPVWSGALATEGGVVFYGTMDGWFKAVDAKDGKLLWKHKTSSGIIGQPVSYRGPDGHQYVAILAGGRRLGGAPSSRATSIRATARRPAGS